MLTEQCYYVLSLDYTSILKIHLSRRLPGSPADRQLAECNMGPYSRAGAPTVRAPATEPFLAVLNKTSGDV